MHPFDIATTLQTERVVRGTVDDMLAERLPGTDGKTREELEALVQDVHSEAIRLFLRSELTPEQAPRWEWTEIVKRFRLTNS